MKHPAITAILFAACALFACNNGKNQEKPSDSSDNFAIEAAADADMDSTATLQTKRFEITKGENRLIVEYPVEGRRPLIDSIRAWINADLTATYRGNPDDADAFFRHYASRLGNDEELNEYGGYSIDEFTVEFTDSRVVTYDYTNYLYEGGAHGMGGSYGTTFLIENGAVFSKECFSSYSLMHSLFIEGLKRYFKVKTDEQLLGCLLNVESLDELPAPAINPWITADGVVFSYTPYEIAPYSSGSPRFTLPVAKVLPFLTPSGLAFFE